MPTTEEDVAKAGGTVRIQTFRSHHTPSDGATAACYANGVVQFFRRRLTFSRYRFSYTNTSEVTDRVRVSMKKCTFGVDAVCPMVIMRVLRRTARRPLFKKLSLTMQFVWALALNMNVKTF